MGQNMDDLVGTRHLRENPQRQSPPHHIIGTRLGFFVSFPGESPTRSPTPESCLRLTGVSAGKTKEPFGQQSRLSHGKCKKRLAESPCSRAELSCCKRSKCIIPEGRATLGSRRKSPYRTETFLVLGDNRSRNKRAMKGKGSSGCAEVKGGRKPECGRGSTLTLNAYRGWVGSQGGMRGR